MALLKKLLFGTAVLAALLVAVGLVLPDRTKVARSVRVSAPAPVVFTLLNGYRHFNRWSPWADLDPDAQYRYSGPVQGVGARMAWAGDPEVGEGAQEIIASVPHETVEVRLEFAGWEDADNRARFDLVPVDGGTEVTWTFMADHGYDLMGRYFGLLMDGFIGEDYAGGLEQLAGFAESLPSVDFGGVEMERVEMPARTVALLSTGSANDPTAIGVALGVAYGRLQGFLQSRGQGSAGPPRALFDPAVQGEVRFDAAIPVAGFADVEGDDEIRIQELGGGMAIRAVHRGARAGLPDTRAAVEAYLAAAGWERAGRHREVYISDPAETPEESLVTHLLYPVR